MFETVVVSTVVVVAVLAATWFFWLKKKLPALKASVVKDVAVAVADVANTEVAVAGTVEADVKKL